jgi:hypothetical protein
VRRSPYGRRPSDLSHRLRPFRRIPSYSSVSCCFRPSLAASVGRYDR